VNEKRAPARARDAAAKHHDLPRRESADMERNGDVAVLSTATFMIRELPSVSPLRAPLCHTIDTEILVHAWEEWGEDALNDLQGMFAFALLDLRRRYATAPFFFLRAIRWNQPALLHTDAGRICIRVRGPGVRLRGSLKATFAGCFHGLFAFRQRLGTGDASRRRVPCLRGTECSFTSRTPAAPPRARPVGPDARAARPRFAKPRDISSGPAPSLLLEEAVSLISLRMCRSDCFFRADWIQVRSRRSPQEKAESKVHPHVSGTSV